MLQLSHLSHRSLDQIGVNLVSFVLGNHRYTGPQHPKVAELLNLGAGLVNRVRRSEPDIEVVVNVLQEPAPGQVVVKLRLKQDESQRPHGMVLKRRIRCQVAKLTLQNLLALGSYRHVRFPQKFQRFLSASDALLWNNSQEPALLFGIRLILEIEVPQGYAGHGIA